MIGQSFAPTGRLTVATITPEILRQWPLVNPELQRLALIVNGTDWRIVLTSQQTGGVVNAETRIASGRYPACEPERKAAKRLAHTLLKSLASVSR